VQGAARALADHGAREDLPTGRTPARRAHAVVDGWELTGPRDALLRARRERGAARPSALSTRGLLSAPPTPVSADTPAAMGLEHADGDVDVDDDDDDAGEMEGADADDTVRMGAVAHEADAGAVRGFPRMHSRTVSGASTGSQSSGLPVRAHARARSPASSVASVDSDADPPLLSSSLGAIPLGHPPAKADKEPAKGAAKAAPRKGGTLTERSTNVMVPRAGRRVR
jgi:kinesin family protein 11